MSYECLNGILLRNLLINGLLNLKNHEKEINKMNVFPVPDGDTGTNMRLTLENAIKNTVENPCLHEFCKKLAKGALLGARGNSGVILSQFIKGMSLSFESLDVAYPLDIVKAFIKGYEIVYKAVVHPTEGTMLTVLREGIENIKNQVTSTLNIEQFFDMYLIELKKSLRNTPNQLDVLKEAHVLDSGGAGIVAIFEGVQKYLHNEKLDATSLDVDFYQNNNDKNNAFNADSTFEYGYCNEFVLQLMNSKMDIASFSLDDFSTSLKEFGNSIVTCKDDDIVKVHIHSFYPAPIMELAQKYGEFVSYKLENMSIQHNESIKERKKMPKKKIGYVSVAQGDGIIDEFKKFGCDIVINGGQTMNSSTDEFIDAFNRINAENIIVLPNDKNLILTALQAKNLTINKNIYIVETKSLQEGYFALSMMDLEESDVKKQINNINLGIKNVVNIKTTKAIRDFSSESFTCLRGDYITFINNKMVSASTSLVESLISAIKNNLSLGDYEICMVIKGQQVKEEIVNQIVDEINLLVDYIDLGVVDGKQDVYDILVGLS